jgi:hypothetical protein
MAAWGSSTSGQHTHMPHLGCAHLPHAGSSELEVQAQCVVKLGHQVSGEAADHGAESFHGDRANLFGLGFGVHVDPGFRCWQEDLEGEDSCGAAGDWHHGDDAATQPCCGGVGIVVAHDDCRPALVRLACAGGFQIDESDLTAEHRPAHRLRWIPRLRRRPRSPTPARQQRRRPRGLGHREAGSPAGSPLNETSGQPPGHTCPGPRHRHQRDSRSTSLDSCDQNTTLIPTAVALPDLPPMVNATSPAGRRHPRRW